MNVRHKTMSAISISESEARELCTLLSVIHVRERTGEIGVVHGLDRFVSTSVCKKKKELDALDAIARRCGLAGLPRFAK